MELYPDLPEGDLSKMRASLVNESRLCELAVDLELSQALRLGKGEKQSGGAAKPRLLACAFEALIGAIYKDSSYPQAKEIVAKLFGPLLESLDSRIQYKEDFKTRLQEKLQGLKKHIPKYRLLKRTGPDHDQTFYIQVQLENGFEVEGIGKSKKQAEQDAARQALEVL